MLRSLVPLLLSLLLLLGPASAQFGNFFNHMFHQDEPQKPQNVGSDSAWYQAQHAAAYCTNYLCPETLACVHFPHHCPCAWPTVEDKFELGAGGSKVCLSKGAFAQDSARKIELARKGLI
jgi:hypothetical protein